MDAIMTDEKKKQYTLRISGANRTGLIVILYDMLLDYVEDAIQTAESCGEEPLCKEKHEGFHFALRHARGCIRELSESLDFHFTPSMELFSLYRYMDRELARAERNDAVAWIRPIPGMIKELREAFQTVAEQDGSPALMENTQTVYAGLTYGKTDLNVNLSDQGMDRGFRV